MPVSRGAPMKLAGSRSFSAAARTMPEPHVHAPAGAPCSRSRGCSSPGPPAWPDLAGSEGARVQAPASPS
jgi:hypothetical protein